MIAEFYLLFPLVLALLRKTRGHHGLLIAVAAVLQFAITIGLHWNVLPYHVVEYAQENAFCYVLYLLGGAVVAVHLSDVHEWLMRNALLVVFLTAVTAIFAEGVYFLTSNGGGPTALGHGSDPFQPSVIPFNVCVIACGYLAGMWLVRPWRHRWIKAAVRVGSDDSYGIYLAQMIFVTALAEFSWRDFAQLMPFYVWLPLTIAVAYLGSIALTELLARTPLAVPLTGRKQVPWRSRPQPRHRRAGAGVPAVAGVPAARPRPGGCRRGRTEPAESRESSTLATTACDQNGA